MCIEYAKRINELQTIARKSSLADLLRYIFTYSKGMAASLGLGRETKVVVENNKNREKLVMQLTKNMMVTASTALDPNEAEKMAGKYTTDYVRKLMDWTFWLKLPGLAVSDALQNVPFGAMMKKYTKVFGESYGARGPRGAPGVAVNDSQPVVLHFVHDKEFNPDCVFPVVKRVEDKYVSAIDRVKSVFEGQHPTQRVSLNPEHASEELANDIRDRLSAFMLAYAAAYAFGVSASLSQEHMCEHVSSTFIACLGNALRPEGYKPVPPGAVVLPMAPVDANLPLQPVEQEPVVTFIQDAKFLCDLKSQEALRLQPAGAQPDVTLATLLGSGDYALAVFLAVLPLIRTGMATLPVRTFIFRLNIFPSVMSA